MPSNEASKDSSLGEELPLHRKAIAWLRQDLFPTVARDWLLSWRDVKRFFKQHRWAVGISFVALLLVVCFYTWPNDYALYKKIGAGKDPEVRKIAQEIGHIGNVAQYNFGVVFAFWAVGKLRKNRYLQRLAIMVALTTILAGATCNVFRFTLGRPRPWTEENPSQFMGPQPQPRFHGFPSGHTSTAFGTAVPTLVATPLPGIPLAVFSASMGWARIYDKQHYPSDVLVGAYLGTVFGLAGGLPLLQVRRRATRIRKARAA